MSKILETPTTLRDGATVGREDYIRGDGTGSPDGLLDNAVLKTVSLAASATPYLYRIPVQGNQGVTITLRPSAIGGTCTARVYTPLLSATINPNVTPTTVPTLTVGNESEVTVPCTGEAFKILEITIGGGPTVFDIAEFRTVSGGGAAGGTTVLAGEAHVGEFGARFDNPGQTFTRPADTTPYSTNDAISNATLNTSVVPMSVALGRIAAGSGKLTGLQLYKNNSSVTNLIVRAHVFLTDPSASGGIVGGDNAAYSIQRRAGYLTSFDFDFTSTALRTFADGTALVAARKLFDGAPRFKLPAGLNAYVLLQYIGTAGTYTPTSAEIWGVIAEVEQN